MSVFTGADGPRLASQALKSRFIPYLKLTEHLRPYPCPDSRPNSTAKREIILRIVVDEAGNLGRIDDDRALLLQDFDRVRHALGLFGIQPAASAAASRQRDS